MLLIVISPEKNLTNEHKALIELFNRGLNYFHIRKPGASKAEIENYINKIPVRYHTKLIIHSHYELAFHYNLKGIHLTEKSKKQSGISKIISQLKNKSISASFHTMKSLKQHRRKYAYVFLSPVFNSISKQHYLSGFDEKQLSSFLKLFGHQKKATKVIALGGINADNLHKVKTMGFDGAALLGSIWESKNPVSAFSRLQSLLPG